jgi:cytoskeleton protein RodZ
MSEDTLPATPGAVPEADLVPSLSAGAMLRAAREAQGLHIAALAVALKVPVKKLEALEADQFDLLPDTVFVRALAASVCRTLKADPAPILEKLPHTTVAHLKTDAAGLNTRFRVPGEGSGLSLLNQFSRPFVLVVALLLLGAVVLLLFFPSTSQPGTTSEPNSELAGVIVSPTSPAPMARSNAVLAEAGMASIPALASSQALSATQVVNGSQPASPPSVRASDSSLLVPGSGATTGVLVLKARGVSWVKVVDAGGIVLLSKNMATGEVAGVSGVMPLSVVLGSVDTIEVQVRGKPFALTGVVKNNVARFEVQ